MHFWCFQKHNSSSLSSSSLVLKHCLFLLHLEAKGIGKECHSFIFISDGSGFSIILTKCHQKILNIFWKLNTQKPALIFMLPLVYEILLLTNNPFEYQMLCKSSSKKVKDCQIDLPWRGGHKDSCCPITSLLSIDQMVLKRLFLHPIVYEMTQ